MRKGEIGKEPEDRRKQESAEKHRDETKKHEEQIHAITAVVTAVDRIATEHQANRDQRDRQERESRQLERRTLCGIWTAAFFALLAVTVTHCDTRDLITDTREIADRQHKDTLKALAETKRQADIADEGLHSVQRAFVATGSLQHETLVDEKGMPRGWRFIPVIKNYGVTLATSVNAISVAPSEYEEIRSDEISRRPQWFSNLLCQGGSSIDKFMDQRDRKLGAPPDPSNIFSSDFASRRFAIPPAILPPNAILTPPEANTFKYEVMFKNTVDAQSGTFGRFFYGAVKYTDIFDKKTYL